MPQTLLGHSGAPAVLSAWALSDRPDRPSPYGVMWTTPEGRKKAYFPTPALRDEKLSALKHQIPPAPSKDLPTAADLEDWRTFRAATAGVPWQDVLAGWRNDLARASVAPFTKTVSDGVVEFLAAAADRCRAGDFCPAYHTHVKQKSRLFAESFGGRQMASVTAEEIEAWIDDLGYPANATFNCYRKIVRMFYQHFKKSVANPCDEIPTRNEDVDQIEILSVPHTEQLFRHAQKSHRGALGRMALEAFAGLRFSSAFRLEKSDINFEDRGILLPAHKIKVRRRHYIDGLPDNLWAWLDATTDDCWAMVSSEWMHLKSRLFTEAGVPHPRNCLRHSFCTYHVAAYKDPGRTATILCHRNQQKLWSSYNGNARQSEGKSYFAITP